MFVGNGSTKRRLEHLMLSTTGVTDDRRPTVKEPRPSGIRVSPEVTLGSADDQVEDDQVVRTYSLRRGKKVEEVGH